MFKNLFDKIEYVRILLRKDPSSIVFGEIRIETKQNAFEVSDPLKDYYEILNRYSHLSCGSILIVGYEEVGEFEYYLSEIPDSPCNWKCIGKSNTYPIFININDATVKILEGEPWTGQQFKDYGVFQDFMNFYVFGDKYNELWGEDDWYNFLKKTNII